MNEHDSGMTAIFHNHEEVFVRYAWTVLLKRSW